MEKIAQNTSIHEKVSEIQEYFISKIIKHDYEIKGFDKYVCTIIIDGKYTFSVWIANNFSIQQWFNSDNNFLKLRDFEQKEKDIIANNLRKVIGKQAEEQERAQKLAEFEKLKEELGI